MASCPHSRFLSYASPKQRRNVGIFMPPADPPGWDEPDPDGEDDSYSRVMAGLDKWLQDMYDSGVAQTEHDLGTHTFFPGHKLGNITDIKDVLESLGDPAADHHAAQLLRKWQEMLDTRQKYLKIPVGVALYETKYGDRYLEYWSMGGWYQNPDDGWGWSEQGTWTQRESEWEDDNPDRESPHEPTSSTSSSSSSGSSNVEDGQSDDPYDASEMAFGDDLDDEESGGDSSFYIEGYDEDHEIKSKKKKKKGEDDDDDIFMHPDPERPGGPVCAPLQDSDFDFLWSEDFLSLAMTMFLNRAIMQQKYY
jgi:hypothetical protein